MLDASYRGFVAAQPHAGLWHEASFLTAICTGEPGAWAYASSRAEDGSLRAVLPYRRKRRPDGWTVHLPPLVRYCGPLLAASTTAPRRVYLELLRGLPSGYVSFDQTWPPPSEGTVPPGYGVALADRGFGVSLRTTHLAALDGDESGLLARLGSSCRYEVRRAKRRLEVRAVTPTPVFHDCLEASLRRRGVAVPYRRESVDAAWLLLAPRGRAVCHAAYAATGDLVGASFAVADARTGYAMLSGARPEGRSLAAGTYVHYADMVWAQRGGCTRFDFLGSDDPGIALNRRRLGGRPTPYPHLYRDAAAWTQALRWWRGRR